MRLLASAVFSTLLAAQSQVSPAHFAVAESPTNNMIPFGMTGPGVTPLRYQQIHDGVPSMQIHGLRFRHDSSSLGTLRSPYSITVSLWLSTAAWPSASASPVFVANHGINRQQVATSRVVTIPANDPSLVPNPFTIDIPFDPGVSFAFPGGGASLCWEALILARTNVTSVPFDACTDLDGANPPVQHSRAFTGCLATGRTLPMTLTPVTVPPVAVTSWPGGFATLATTAVQLAANGPVVFAYGTSRTTWNGLALPFVIPGSIGAPSGQCVLHTDIGFSQATIATSLGTAAGSLAFPINPAMHGTTIHTQVVGLDPIANATGLTTSNLVTQQLCASHPVPLGVRRIFEPTGLGTMGSVGGVALVTQFY
jgi:hypothetical protein